ncbi:MAG: alpha/beta hydrolase [Alphaproteobacteria bacterium]
MTDQMVATSHGQIAVAESGGSGPAVLFIHGNSSCKEVFRNQMEGAIGQAYRCIAMDLPGHGNSPDAAEPTRSYTMPGYAEAALEVMQAKGAERYAIVGWSLGGHIGIEMLPRAQNIAGLLITGTPPVSKGEESVAAGFLPSEHMGLAGQEVFSEADADAYAHATCGINAPFEPFLLDAVRRTDGRARRCMFEAFLAGQGNDQRDVVESSKVPLAVANGGAEPFVNNDYCRSVDYANLWDGQVHTFEGVGHAPFWETPAAFDALLQRFLKDIFASA